MRNYFNKEEMKNQIKNHLKERVIKFFTRELLISDIICRMECGDIIYPNGQKMAFARLPKTKTIINEVLDEINF